MADQKLIDAVGKYIDQVYIPERDDIVVDREMESIFAKISGFRKRRAKRKELSIGAPPSEEKSDEADEECSFEIDEKAAEEFDPSTMTKTKLKTPMSSTIATSRRIDDLMSEMTETFSQRLLRMIDERGLTDSEVYSRARVDRRHFSKIRNDVNYAPNKKTVLAFAIALELSIDETKDLLNSAGFALTRSSKTDIIIAYFLQNKIYDMTEIDDVLDAYGQQVI